MIHIEDVDNRSDFSLTDWAIDQLGANRHWIYAKRLSANDTQANGAHQAGPYLPKQLVFGVFEGIEKERTENAKREIELYIDSHNEHAVAVITWYNNKYRGGTRDEARMTSLGGASSPLLDPANTGAIAVFSFESPDVARVWVTKTSEEEDVITEFIGPLDPGESLFITSDGNEVSRRVRSADAECRVTADNLPTSWKTNFPSPSEIIAESFRRSGGQQIGDPDASLVRRRSCETSLFYEVERLHEFPIAEAGYPSIEAFIKHANSVLQRRKARSGRSLELHFKQVLEDCGLIEEANFSHQATTEGKKTPDFIFPNAAAYRDPKFPESRLLMLAAKTSCRDRWRQILNEADRVPAKHLLTLQEGVSEDQFNEMRAANVQLVVPKSVQTKYPPSIQAKLLSVDQFIDLVRNCEQH